MQMLQEKLQVGALVSNEPGAGDVEEYENAIHIINNNIYRYCNCDDEVPPQNDNPE